LEKREKVESAVWNVIISAFYFKRDSHFQKKVPLMKERRQYARLTISLPVRLKTITLDGKKVLDLETRDISYSGTFITTLTSFPEGTRFILDFTVPSNNLKYFKDIKILKRCKGSMLRSTPNGIAIQFDKECQIEGFKTF
jgi:hypothetical protein